MVSKRAPGKSRAKPPEGRNGRRRRDHRSPALPAGSGQFTDPGFTHLFVVPADGGTPRALTSGDWNVGARFDGIADAVGLDWSPDGRTIVVDGLDVPDADLRYRDSDIFTIEVASGERRKVVAQAGSWSNPRFSPDGKLLAFTGHPSTKASYKSEDLYVVSPQGTGMRSVSSSLDRDPTNLLWARGGLACISRPRSGPRTSACPAVRCCGS